MYRSKHLDKHVSSELENAVEGFVMHFAKHLSFIVFSSSCAFVNASSLRTWFMTASFRAVISAGGVDVASDPKGDRPDILIRDTEQAIQIRVQEGSAAIL